MAWNYRVVHAVYKPGTPDEDHTYSLHEVYYNDRGEITLWSKDSISAIGGTADELLADLTRMAEAHKKPVLEWDELPGAVAHNSPCSFGRDGFFEYPPAKTEK